MAAKFKPCAVGGCNGNAHYTASGARGFCAMHYIRAKRHGDPQAGRAFAGEAEAWLDQHRRHSGDGCLIWPFGRATGGYGVLRRGDELIFAHRAMCELAHGKPPTADHEAAHWCGNGHAGCVAPNHLRWATSAENKADTVAHGTIARGERHGHAKLTADEVRAIRRLARTEPHSQIAERFDISRRHVRALADRKSWAWLE